MSQHFDHHGETNHKQMIEALAHDALAATQGTDLNYAVLALKIEVDRLREQRDRAMSDLAHANLVIHEKAVEMHDMRARLDDGS